MNSRQTTFNELVLLLQAKNLRVETSTKGAINNGIQAFTVTIEVFRRDMPNSDPIWTFQTPMGPPGTWQDLASQKLSEFIDSLPDSKHNQLLAPKYTPQTPQQYDSNNRLMVKTLSDDATTHVYERRSRVEAFFAVLSTDPVGLGKADIAKRMLETQGIMITPAEVNQIAYRYDKYDLGVLVEQLNVTPPRWRLKMQPKQITDQVSICIDGVVCKAEFENLASWNYDLAVVITHGADNWTGMLYNRNERVVDMSQIISRINTLEDEIETLKAHLI